jgi:hypothetical protein
MVSVRILGQRLAVLLISPLLLSEAEPQLPECPNVRYRSPAFIRCRRRYLLRSLPLPACSYRLSGLRRAPNALKHSVTTTHLLVKEPTPQLCHTPTQESNSPNSRFS